MKAAAIRNYHLVNQQIATTRFTTPEEIVMHLGAMQAQEFAMAKWAIGLRLPGSTDQSVEQAFNEGRILRTHLLRPTWHFVGPADIRWLLALTAPRVHALNAFMYRQLELDKKIFSTANAVIIKSLEGGTTLTRHALQAVLAKRKITANGMRLAYLVMQAELDGIICSGPRQGKQFSYALLEERVAPAKKLNKAEALAALSLRYFTSRCPATLADFVTWSGLTMKDARTAAATLPAGFNIQPIDGKEYIVNPSIAENVKKMQTTFLMPDYDEYGMGYKDRSALSKPSWVKNKPKYTHFFVLDGVIAGSWQPVTGKKITTATMDFSFALNKRQERAVSNAIKRYRTFCSTTSDKRS